MKKVLSLTICSESETLVIACSLVVARALIEGDAACFIATTEDATLMQALGALRALAKSHREVPTDLLARLLKLDKAAHAK